MPWTVNDLPPSVAAISASEDWSDAQKETFVATANAILDEGEPEGEAIATGIGMAREKKNEDLEAPEADQVKAPSGGGDIMKTETETTVIEKTNAKEFPRMLYARHMNNGLCGYGDETVLVTTETMKKMCSTFTAKPVYVDHQKVELETLQADADGYVSRCFYNELDGWLWNEIIVVSDNGHEAVRKGWSVSNAYLPLQSGQGGTCHDVAYDREILEGEFTHLAIVANPRYEDALIMTPKEFKAYQASLETELAEMQNSKEKPKEQKVMKFWKKTEVTNADELQNAMTTLENGEDISIADAIKQLENAHKKNDDDENDEKENASDDMTVEVTNAAGEKEKITVGEMVNRLNKMNAKHADDEKANAEEDEKAKAKEKENAEEDEKIKAEEKENAKHFDELKNAGKEKQPVTLPYSRLDGLAAGKAKY